MKKVLSCTLTVLLALIMGILLASCLTSTEEQIDIQAIGRRPLVPYGTEYFGEITEDTWAILVDLDDNANWPHVLENKIILKRLQLGGDLSDAAHWHTKIGVVTAIATTGLDIEWVHSGVRIKATQFNYNWDLPEHGLSLAVVGSTLDRVLTNEITTTVAVTSETHLPSPLGTAAAVTVTAEVGDLILYTQEIITGATLHLYVHTSYDTE